MTTPPAVAATSSSPMTKTAIVIGASSGIGAAIAVSLGAAGYSVALAARRAEKLAEVLATIRGAGGTAIAVPTDVTSGDAVKALVAAAEKAHGPTDLIVNSAGCMYFTLMKNVHEAEWDRMLQVNCKGLLNTFGAVLPAMKARGKGHVVVISSDASKRMFPTLAVYCASKTFVDVLCEGTRRELVGTGIRITVVQPGDVKTDLVMANTDEEAAKQLGVKIGAVVGEGWATENNLLKPEDVADAVMYAVAAPPHVAMNEVLIEPRDQA